jgi:AAA family ATP:ADP antiporter
VRRWLGIEPGEGRVFAWGTLALGLLGWAEVSLRNVSETLFLKKVGVEHLPSAFLLNDVLLLGATVAFVGAAARSDRLRLLPRMLALMGLAVVPLWALTGSYGQSGYVVLLVASKLVPSLALIVFWIALGDLLHGRQAKRLFAPMTAGGTLGIIAGSFASKPLGELLGIGGLLPLTGGILLLAAAAALPLRRLRAPLERLSQEALRPRRVVAARNTRAATTSFGGLWRESDLFKLLVVVALCGGILGPMLYWQFSYVADRATQGADGEARLLAFYASFRGWINLGVLGAQLFATSGLFRRIGIPLASAIPPVVYLLGFAGLAGQMSLAIGVGAMAATRLQDKAIYDPALRVLFSLFPEAIRSRASASIEGPVKRAGGAIGNVAVLGALALASPVWVGRAALPVALAWLVAALWLWRRYPRLLLRSVAERVWGDGTLEHAELLDRATVRALASELGSQDPARLRAAVGLVADAEPSLAAEVFAASLERAPAQNRSILIGALDRVLEATAPELLPSAEAARSIALRLAAPGDLSDRDRADLVQAYGRLSERSPRDALLRGALDDASPAVRLAALMAIARAGGELPHLDLDAELARELHSGDPVARRTAREECRWLLLAGPLDARFDARLAWLAGLLAHPDERADAAESLADVAARRGARAARVAEAMLALRGNPDPRLRMALLRYVGHAQLAEQAGWLVAHLVSPNESWAAAAREGLRALGPRCAEVLLRELGFGKRSLQTALVALVRELDIGQGLLRELYEREIEAVRLDLVYVAALGDRPHFAIVRQRLVERIDEQLHAALGLLAARQHDDRIAELGDQLRFARGGRRYSILVEALDSLLEPRERQRLIPLLEQGDLGRRAQLAADALGRPLPKLEETIEALLADPEDLARTLIAGVALAGRAHVGDHEVVKPVEIALQLRALPFFEALTTRQLVDLARVVKEEQHAAGDCLAREGSFDDCLYLLVEGVVSVTNRGAFLTELGPGSFFGEVAVFEGGARSATVTATSRVRALRLERADLMERMEELPGLAIGICQALSRRVRELTDRVQQQQAPPRERRALEPGAGGPDERA